MVARCSSDLVFSAIGCTCSRCTARTVCCSGTRSCCPSSPTQAGLSEDEAPCGRYTNFDLDGLEQCRRFRFTDARHNQLAIEFPLVQAALCCASTAHTVSSKRGYPSCLCRAFASSARHSAEMRNGAHFLGRPSLQCGQSEVFPQQPFIPLAMNGTGAVVGSTLHGVLPVLKTLPGSFLIPTSLRKH